MATRLNIILIWISFIGLLTLGLIMVASTSSYAETAEKGVIFNHFVCKQIMLALAGIATACALALYDYRKLRYWVPYIWGLCVILLILCLTPKFGLNLGIAKEANGEWRWLLIGGQTFQPSELAKVGIMICMAHWYTLKQKQASGFVQGFFKPSIIFGIPVFLILIEKDMGTAAALSLSGLCLMYSAGSRWWMLMLAALMGALILYFYTTSNENRMIRIDAWHDLEGSKLGAGRQQWLSSLAFARGGLSGTGIGSGIGKINNIPEAHTDFIFATIGEELGLIGSGGIIILFSTLAFFSIRLAACTQEQFGRLLVIAYTCIITWPALLNIMVVSSVVPNTGLPLPFISYGGTNLFITTCTIGIMTSVYIHSPQKKAMYWPKFLLLTPLNRKQ